MSENHSFFWPDPSPITDISEDLLVCSVDAINYLEADQFTQIDHLSETSLFSQSKKIRKESVSARSCSTRSSCHSSPTNKTKKVSNKIAQGNWNAQEDAQVIELYNTHGPKWAMLASIMKTRTRKQIRDRYLNLLRPDINYSDWTKEEEELLAELHEKYGNKWSKIAAEMPGRSENQVKNKFYYTTKKALLQSKNQEQEQEVFVDIMSPQQSIDNEITDCFFSIEPEVELALVTWNQGFMDSFDDISLEM